MSARKVSVDGAFLAADQAYREASARALAALRAALPRGRWVTWSHGDQLRGGVVVSVAGFQYGHASVRVRSDVSGKEVWVGAGRILERLKALGAEP